MTTEATKGPTAKLQSLRSEMRKEFRLPPNVKRIGIAALVILVVGGVALGAYKFHQHVGFENAWNWMKHDVTLMGATMPAGGWVATAVGTAGVAAGGVYVARRKYKAYKAQKALEAAQLEGI